jgi:hypothetical protein
VHRLQASLAQNAGLRVQLQQRDAALARKEELLVQLATLQGQGEASGSAGCGPLMLGQQGAGDEYDSWHQQRLQRQGGDQQQQLDDTEDGSLHLEELSADCDAFLALDGELQVGESLQGMG